MTYPIQILKLKIDEWIKIKRGYTSGSELLENANERIRQLQEAIEKLEKLHEVKKENV